MLNNQKNISNSQKKNLLLIKKNISSIEKSFKSNQKILSNFKNIIPHLKKVPKEKFSYLNYWIDRYLNFLEIYDLTEIAKKEQDFDLENEIILRWQKTDFMKPFIINAVKKSVYKSSTQLLPKEELQLVDIFNVYLLNKKPTKKFIPIYELGSYKFSKIKTIQFDVFNFHYKNQKELEQIDRLAISVEILKKFHPRGYNLLSKFTSDIIANQEQQVVSFSMEPLPGFSAINLFERDDVDLLDDLLHENGHHILNSFLRWNKFLNEDEEKIFYSPWRRALRPIRGIYHAVNTFYYAADLFITLLKNKDLNLYFSQKQIQKIRYRFCEEYLMLNYSIIDLKNAYRLGKITSKGFKFISEIISSIKKMNSSFDSEVKKLSPSQQNKLKKLNILLKNKRTITDQLLP